MGRRVTSSPTRSKTFANQLNFRPLTAQIVQQEYQALLTSSCEADAFRRLASRLNRWIAAADGVEDTADLAVIE